MQMRSLLNSIKILITFCCITQFAAFAQPECLPQSLAYQSGEVIRYDIKYNWGMLWVDAGEVFFAVEDTIYQGQKAYWFKSYGRSKPKWDWMYEVRDTFDAVGTINQLTPLFFRRNTKEGSYKVDNIYKFHDSKASLEAYIWNSDLADSQQKILDYNECIWDVLNAVYYARNIRYNDYQVGEKIPFNLIIDGKINHLYIRYLGKEILEMPSEKKYMAIKFSALLVDGTIFDGGEDMTVWVTDDKNKVPLKVEAKIKVGSVKAFLTHTKGLKHNNIKAIAD